MVLKRIHTANSADRLFISNLRFAVGMSVGYAQIAAPGVSVFRRRSALRFDPSRRRSVMLPGTILPSFLLAIGVPVATYNPLL